MKFRKFLSAFLTLLMLLSIIPTALITPIFAADEETEEESDTIDYLTKVFESDEEKLATMELKVENDYYELYVETYTAEVALRNKKTGEIVFTNPINIPETFVSANSGKETTSSADIKKQLLSQVVISYTDNDKEVNFYSFTEACERGQIKIKNVKNGIRIEYKLGKQETRKLVPRMIEKSRFEENILAYMVEDATAYKKVSAYYTLKDPEDPDLTEKGVKDLYVTYPITQQMAVYVFDKSASEREYNLVESYIKKYCPHYTYETLQEDHNLVEYENEDTDTALFSVSLEYYLDEYGLSVRLPANGISFNESKYSLNSIKILPYFGAGDSDNTGYTFYPDGDGTLVRFEDLTAPRTISGTLYGTDFGYQTIKTSHMETIRMPVYGVVEDKEYSTTETKTVTTEGYTDEFGDYIAGTTSQVEETTTWTEKRGFLAIIEEGDALATVTTTHGAYVTHRYNSVYTSFNPRPSDTYTLQDGSAKWTVVSKRKYTGSYRIRIIMLSDPSIAEAAGVTDYYEASYVGMAKAYREYLEANGILTRLTEEDVEEDIPLYIESFGIIDTDDTFLSFPITVKTPLTTFEDLKTMASELADEGITNIKYRLTGYTNGGMTCTMPYHVKFEKNIGGNDGYVEFVKYCEENGIGCYVDYDFMYCQKNKLFDGYTSRNDAIKTIDDRYTRKREYSAVAMGMMSTGFIAVSPSVLMKFYNQFYSEISELGINSISVSTLGTDLNSDFDEDDPYNREDAKEFVTKVLSAMKEQIGDIMVDGGNAYVLGYVNHILNVTLDSSRHVYASEAVPFTGMVLHGYIQFAGTPTNMAGDINYEILKIIENGASPYFTLSYRNTEKLKEAASDYYSVSYEIWKDDLVKYYKQINEALKDLQTSTIVNHEFLIGEREPTESELEAVAKAEEEEAEAEQEAWDKEYAARLLKAQREAYLNGEDPNSVTVDMSDYEEQVAKAKELEEETEGYTYTPYTIDSGIVRVTYEDGTQFILNYNSYDITTEGYTVPAIGYIIIK